MHDLVIAIVLIVASLWASIVALAVRATIKNYDSDTLIQWRISKGPFFSFGYGKQSIRIQSWIATTLSLAFFSASVFFALRALLANWEIKVSVLVNTRTLCQGFTGSQSTFDSLQAIANCALRTRALSHASDQA